MDNGTFEYRTVGAKAFVAPLKRKTIPRLDLMGCVTLTRLMKIQEGFAPTVWNYVPSEQNPTDALTKGISLRSLEKWHHSPDFLARPEN